MATLLALKKDEVAISSLQVVLQSFGHTVVPVSTVEELLQELRARDYDLILFDLHMEGLNALLVLSQILELRPSARIAALTAYPKEPLALAVLEKGARCLMRKPYEIGQILQLLE